MINKLLNSKLTAFEFWDKATSAKENYRESVIMGINGKEDVLNAIKKTSSCNFTTA